MSKYYAVKGEQNSIFDSWDECKEFLKDKKGYKQKSFASRAEAEAYLRGEDFYEECVRLGREAGYVSAYTDGSFEQSRNAYSYGVLTFDLSGEVREFSGRGDRADFLSSRNVAGEAEGALAAIRWAFVNGYGKLRLYHDYSGLGAWARGEWGAKSPVAAYYKKQYDRYVGAVKVEFVQVKGHSNDAYNERVDKLAKAALFDGKILPVEGLGAKLAGTGEARPLVQKIHALYKKADYVYVRDGVIFKLKCEKLGIYDRNGVTLVSGDGDEMFFVAISELVRTRAPIERIRLIESTFDVTVTDGAKGTDLSRALLKSRKYYPSLCVVFALDFVADSILERLRYFGQRISKISAAFDKDENGEYVMTIRVPGKDELIKAYDFLYKHRLGFAGLDLDYEKAEKLVDECEEVTRFKCRGFYG